MSDPLNLVWRVPECDHQMEQFDIVPWEEQRDGKTLRQGPWSKKCMLCGLTATQWEEVKSNES